MSDELLRRVIDLIEENRIVHTAGMWHYCASCGAGVPVADADHEDDCEATALLRELRALTEPTPAA